jgi:hypothetical protein
MSDDRQRIVGVKVIAALVEKLTGLSFSRSAASHAARPGRRRRLPVQWSPTGRAWAFVDEVRAWALRPYRRRRATSRR